MSSAYARLAAAFAGLLLIVVGDVGRGERWSPWLAPIGLAIAVAAQLPLGPKPALADRRRVAFVGVLAGGAAVHDAAHVAVEVAAALVLAGTLALLWHLRPRRAEDPPAG